MKRELLIPAKDIAHQVSGHEEHVLVDRLHLLERDLIALRIEAVQIAQNPAERIADIAIIIRNAIHQFVGGMHILAEVDRRNPQTHDLRAQLFCHFHGIDTVAQRLRHCAPLRIKRPAAGDGASVRRTIASAYRA